MPLSNPPLPIPGTSGNLLTSNGVNWISATPVAGGGTTPQAPQVNLTFASNGDTNGLFYYLGTNKNTVAFSNPALSGKVIITAFSQYENYSPSNLVGRDSSFYNSIGGSGNFVKFDLGATYTLALNYYTFLGSGSNSYHPRNWKFQGSINDSTWTDLDVQVNNTEINQNTYFSKGLTQSADYRFFRFIITGVDSSGGLNLIGSEIELYGTLKG